ncbi:MAG: hypothetical protein ABIP89_22610, partial [Polyangiaceae bacterium]
MKTCGYDGPPFTEPRSHPWTDAVSSSAYRYLDLKADPSLVRTSLEDFVPWSNYPAVRAFYMLIEWLNAEAGSLESNDCAFTAPHRNETASVPKTLECSGRIMILFRALAENLSADRTRVLENDLHRRLGALDPEFEWGMIGTTIVPVRYLALPRDAQLGHQLMISFWAWGDGEMELMTNLDRVVA